MASLVKNFRHFGKMNISHRLVKPQTKRTYSYRIETNKKEGGGPAFGISDKFHHPSPYEKRIMVLTKIYPSIDAIPKTVSYNAILRAKDRMRVMIAFGMIGMTMIGYAAIMRYSRKLRAEGDGIMKRTFEWQRSLATQKEQEENAKESSK